MSVPEDISDISRCTENEVLKKVGSLSLSKAELEAKILKPKFVPKKLDFKLYEKFEGELITISKKMLQKDFYRSHVD